MIKFIHNTGEYFSSNYFDEDFASKVLSKTGYASEVIKDYNKKLTPIKERYYRFKQTFIEGKLRIKDKIYETHQFHTLLLNALGYDGNNVEYSKPFHLTDQYVIPVRHILYRGNQPHLIIMEMQSLIKENNEANPDGLFDQRYNIEDEEISTPAQRYHKSQWERVFTTPDDLKISPKIIHEAITALFLIDPHIRPKYILLLAGNTVFLMEHDKWDRGSYLEFDLEELFSEADAYKTANYYSLFYFLVGKESLAPDSNMVLLDQLDEDSHKSAYEVTKDLKEGIIHAVEALANEALWFHKNKEKLKEDLDETDNIFEQEIKDDCLKIIYRLLFIFYAESREDLDILPSNDPIYNKGYSLEMLRDLEQVPMNDEKTRDGYFFHESLNKLFNVLSCGYCEKENGNNKSFKVRHIDSPIFDDRKLHHLHKVKFRNKVWQDIICRLSLSKQVRNRNRGRISYANLGINQLGSVYESLLAYRGFYAEQDYIEVHKAGKPEEGTYLVPRSRRDDFEENEILKDDNYQDIILNKGTFVYRLSGRDRQKSASYYTPEVLTRCTVKYTLKPILEKVENGHMKALELLELKLLEPAIGAAAFHNEMINQLAEAYLNYRQIELRISGRNEWKVEPDKYKEELQKVKAYIATNNVYGVDINPTAIELGKLSLWLNVMYKDMETPFFSNRICVGNAVVGAWLKVYSEKELSEEYEIIKDARGREKRVLKKKEWWEKAPKQLEFIPNSDHKKFKTNRKTKANECEIYHFLLPDKNMVASSGIRMLKDEYPANAKHVAKWKSDWCKPLKKQEIIKLIKLSSKIDELLAEYYRFQRTINIKTKNKQNIFGALKKEEQLELQLSSYDEKEKLADQRNRHDAPYFKLKMVMDYWCSLWFWDIREAGELPTRQKFWEDIEKLLEIDLAKETDEYEVLYTGQQKLFENEVQMELNFANEPNDSFSSEKMMDVLTQYTDKEDLFVKYKGLRIVRELSDKYKFFHPQLEFLEVFWERGGFDLIAGNPPWVKIKFEEGDILSDKYPEIYIKEKDTTDYPSYRTLFFQNDIQKELFFQSLIELESVATFTGSMQSYPLLMKQQSNLYKCILENSFNLINKNANIGLLHPEGVYDDPKAGLFRSEMYLHLRYHFQFQNEQFLFSEVGDRFKFSINVYSSKKESISFSSINNLYTPKTLDGIFIHDGTGENYGIKIKTDLGYIWNTIPHKYRIVKITEFELKIFAESIENDVPFYEAKLPVIHDQRIIKVLKAVINAPNKVSNIKHRYTEGWHESEDAKSGIIKKTTKFPVLDDFEMIYSGPHFYVNQPFYKTPRSKCTEKSHYDIIDSNFINEEFLPRTNFLPNINIDNYQTSSKFAGIDGESMLLHFRAISSTGLNQAAERTFQPAIIFPKVAHVNSVNTIQFENNKIMVEFVAITSSLFFDFLIKTIGRGGFYAGDVKFIPFGLADEYLKYLQPRVLLLNSQTIHYKTLWEEFFAEDWRFDKWSKTDLRLKDFLTLLKEWNSSIPLHNSFERRHALIEIDVIVAKGMGLDLDQLILMYRTQFPVLEQNEDDTWYDKKGNIVFTCSKGLVGVGVDRPIWEQIRNLKEGETYEHIITKSELYHGNKITYYAPFDKCDRVEDYKIAWKHFKEIFNQNNN